MALPSVTNTFTNGTDTDATAVNQNFTDLINAMTDSSKSFAIDVLTVGGTLGVIGNFAVNTNKFTVAASSGNTIVAGTLGVTGASTFTGAATFAGGVTFNGGITLGADDDLIGSSTSDITFNTDKFTVAGATGNTVIAGTATITGALTQTGAVAAAASITLGAGADLIGSATSDITINTNKFTVAGATGNTVVAGTIDVTGAATFTGGVTFNGGITLGAGDDLIGSSTSDITFNTNKFTVAGATGNTVVAGTLGVTGVGTFTAQSVHNAGITDGTATLNGSGVWTGITSLTVDNILINGNDISSTAGVDLTISPLAGQQIVLDGTIVVDAGVVTGATSITSTAFVGALTGQADTVATIAGLAPDTATTQATQASITTCANLVTVGALNAGSITSGFTSIDVGAGSIDGGVITADTNFAGALTGNVTGNCTGSSGSTTGNAATATALATGRTIGGVSFDGTANITVASATGGFTVTGNLTDGTATLSSGAWSGITTLATSGAITSSNGLSTFAYTTVDGNTPLTVTNSGVTMSRFIGAASDTTITNFSGSRLALKNTDSTANNYTQIQFEESNGSNVGGIVMQNIVHSGSVPESQMLLAVRNGASIQGGVTIAKDGAIRFNAYGAGTATFDASGNITAVSDIAFKEDVTPFTRGLDAIMGLEPSNYMWKKETGLDRNRNYSGFIAQNVKENIPEAIDGVEGKYSLSDRPIIAALVNGMKEQQAEIKELKEMIN